MLPEDKINSSTPEIVTFTYDKLQKSVGFMNMKKVLDNLDVAQDTISMTSTSKPETVDKGNMATMRQKNRSTKTAERPNKISHTFHYNIGYSTTNAIGGIKYALAIIDREVRKLYTYPLRNLQEQSSNRQWTNL